MVIRILVSDKALLIRATDAAKLAGQPSLRGWGFFLIEKMMVEQQVRGDMAHHLIELFLYREGGNDDA